MLAKQLWPDLRAWAVTTCTTIRNFQRRACATVYGHPQDLQLAIDQNTHRDGDVVTLDCRPSLYGRFLRHHFLNMTSGPSSDLRLGPRVTSRVPFMDILGGLVTHLAPVGLYPPLDGGIQQACLYPIDAVACGGVSFTPILDITVPHISALLAPRHLSSLNRACRITGTLRVVTADVLTAAGFSPEIAEKLRQQGAVWILDASDDISDCAPNMDVPVADLWGGLYAHGHIEVPNNTLPYDDVVGVFNTAMSTAGYRPHISKSSGQVELIEFHAKGLRACLSLNAPIYSLHMDAEMANHYTSSVTTFSSLVEHTLVGIRDVCASKSVQLGNPLDLDFSYSNATTSYTVMRSMASDQIIDPVALVLRDWHRRRSPLPT